MGRCLAPVDVNVCSATKGVTALMAAVGQGHVECVAYLLEQKADVTIVTTGDQFTKGMIALTSPPALSRGDRRQAGRREPAR